jgi:Rne/Rng family ribonuclease
MLINATHPEEHRVAIIEDGNLTELDIEIAGKEQTKGNIYKAVVARVESGLQAAFVDFGSERLGFLQIGEIHPTFFRDAESRTEAGKRPRITDLLRRGQEILVQVVKEERGTKGAALTTYLSLPGRYMVLMPETDTKGISRKIEKEGDRKKLKEIMESLELPDHMGYIVRTAGSVQKKTDLKRDVDYLLRLYEKIRQQGQASKAPALIYKESNLVIRSIRDYFSDEMDEVLVDDARVAAEAREFFQEVMPEYAQLVKLHQERRPIFSRYQIEEQIDTITKNKVMLPSGGSIVIDSTEALVAIDVNSGKMASEQGVEATAFKTNLEAAVEAARQLRLRDLGVGALLHDVGKLMVPQEIVNKTDRLTAGELAEVRKHAMYGFEALRKNPDVNLISAHCAFQHHERYDGSGYPRSLQNSDIHQFAQIVALADVYDALTADVSYRPAVSVYEALAIITRGAGSYFDPALVESFVANIAPYPIGSVVRLSDNRVGVVVDISQDCKTNPVVRVIADENKRRVNELVEIDLSKNSRLYVADVVER